MLQSEQGQACLQVNDQQYPDCISVGYIVNFILCMRPSLSYQQQQMLGKQLNTGKQDMMKASQGYYLS